jgi:hypothetical protein
MDLQERVRELEQLASKMGHVLVDQQRQIDRLREELSDEITANAIKHLTPWPTTHYPRIRTNR